MEVGSYSAAHKRRGLASVIMIKWRAWCGAPRYSCIVTATVGGCIYATTITVRHISIANCAFALAFRGQLSCSQCVMRIIGATNGRMPCRTWEYKFVKDARHCQYANGCDFATSAKNTFSMAVSLGRMEAAGKSIKMPMISVWYILFYG